MIYASGKDGDWTILDGWHGCQAGQGDILMQNVKEADIQKMIAKFEKKEK